MSDRESNPVNFERVAMDELIKLQNADPQSQDDSIDANSAYRTIWKWHKSEVEAEASRREQAAEIKGAYFAASSILLEMSPLLVHRTERGFPEMTAEVIGKTYEAVKKEMQPYQAERQALTKKEGR